MPEKLILGVSASPRKGANTDILLETALKAAEETEGIKTEIVYLRDYEIHPCVSCFACCSEVAQKNNAERACLMFRDGMEQLYPKLLACDGLIVATPVYFGSLSGQAKCFIDRTEGLLRYGKSKYKNALQHKVGGAIAVGGNRNAGEEFAIQTIHYFMHVQDMIVVGSGGEPTPGCYLGGAGTTWPQKGQVRDAVKQDVLGLKSSGNLGRNVAQVLMMLK